MTAYPDGPLDARAELLLGGTWTDVTGWAMPGGQQDADITGGTSDGASQPEPTSLAVTWDNPDGRFSPRNAASPYYGQLHQNTRARVSVAADAGYLRLEDDGGQALDGQAFAQCPSTSALSPSAGIDVRIDFRLSDWRLCTLVSKWGDIADVGWALRLDEHGQLALDWYAYEVVTYTLAAPGAVALTGRQVFRFVINATAGTVTMYRGESMSGPWTGLVGWSGLSTAALAGSTAPLKVGYGSGYFTSHATYDRGLTGEVHAVEVLDTSGTVLAAPDFTAAAAAGATSDYTDPQGNAWSVYNGAAWCGRDYRINAELSSIVPAMTGSESSASVAAQLAGPLRRIQAGTAPPVMSPMRRAELLQSGDQAPVAYWPMEDPAGSAELASAVSGVPAMAVSGALEFAADSSFASSSPLPVLSGARLTASVPATYTDYGSDGGVMIRWLMKLSSADIPSSSYNPMAHFYFSGSSAPILSLRVYGGGGMGLTAGTPDGTVVFDTGAIAWTEPPADTLKWCSIEIKPVSGGQQYTIALLTPGEGTGYLVQETVSGGVRGRLWQVQFGSGAFTSSVIGHLTVQSCGLDSQGNLPSLWDLGPALTAYEGEIAADRFARVCGENGYLARITGVPGLTQPMGPQPSGTFQSLLQDIAQADGGLLYEPPASFAVGYRTLCSMYNQSPAATFSFASANLPGQLQAADDDTDLINDWTVSQPSGTSVRVTLDDPALQTSTATAGAYQGTATANVLTADQLTDAAGTKLALSAADEARFRQVGADAGIPGAPAIGAVRPGDLIAITDVPGVIQSGDIRAIVTGTEELIGPGRTVTWDCQPASAYDVAVYDTGRADTDGSQLAASVDATAVTLSVATTGPSGIPWTTAAADLPMDITVAGERMTVTAVTGTASPQSMTVARGVNGVVKAHAAGEDVRLADTPRYAWI